MASSNTISWKLKSSCYLFAHVSIKKSQVKFTIQIVVCSREGSKTTKHVSVANLLWLLGGVAFWLPFRFGELWSHNPCHPSIHTPSPSILGVLSLNSYSSNMLVLLKLGRSNGFTCCLIQFIKKQLKKNLILLLKKFITIKILS